MKIYSLNDRITVKVGELTFKLAPLSYKQKIEIQNIFKESKDAEGSILCLKYSVKDVEGIETLNGEKYNLSFDESGLTDTCLNDLLNIELSPKLMIACATLVNGIPQEIVHPVTGKPLEGVKIIHPFLKNDALI
jgi:hypothetical protein